LELPLALARALLHSEVARNYVRAVEVSHVLDEMQNIFLSQCLFAVSHFTRGQMHTSQELAKLVEMTEGTEDPTPLFLAHGSWGRVHSGRPFGPLVTGS